MGSGLKTENADSKNESLPNVQEGGRKSPPAWWGAGALTFTVFLEGRVLLSFFCFFRFLEKWNFFRNMSCEIYGEMNLPNTVVSSKVKSQQAPPSSNNVAPETQEIGSKTSVRKTGWQEIKEKLNGNQEIGFRSGINQWKSTGLSVSQAPPASRYRPAALSLIYCNEMLSEKRKKSIVKP